jgi:hypothetical protein
MRALWLYPASAPADWPIVNRLQGARKAGNSPKESGRAKTA